jgi:hypothetical protein
MAVLGLHRDLDDTSGPIVLHSPWWLGAHWGRAFETVTLRPAGFVDPGLGHGVFVGLKRDVALSTEDLERPDPGDPRELAAQRTQLRVLEENAARLGERIRGQRDRIAKLAIAVKHLRDDRVARGSG